ncbi:adenylate/guanylate cyclase domain-containing protein [Ruegeria lacuscaerulensis]|uniref:adenylate/guanylate cyclase domain-containing protein n=1 Tax=Ruegeria lacuscaerulensis TaxID=55218 RepID=UPI00147C0B79|nr:adenylate/guanylate cyclase domain-containing protein [Ruegeria lacuscaerulensis]
MKRRLAAILAADVVGYSRLVRSNEERTLAKLRELRESVVEPAVAKHAGRVVKWMGDGVLTEFASAVDAVSCAYEIQSSIHSRNREALGDQEITFRVGINIGDVVVEGDDIHGDGVNVASRLETLSDPGGICISASVHEQIKHRLNVPFQDAGAQQVKNIVEPIRIWKWTNSANDDAGSKKSTSDSALNSAPSLPEIPSIAVLPFDNMSGDAEQEYFADGMTEDLITDLSKLSGLLVIGRNSSFVYKGKAVDLRLVGKELGVHYVLEGSIRRAGNRIRMNAQLIETGNGSHVWANRRDGTLEDVFDLQDEITREIVDALSVQLREGEETRLGSQYTSNTEARDWFLKGRQRYREPGPQANAEAQVLFTKALEADPNFAYAMAVRSYLKFHAWFFKWNSHQNAFEEALAEAELAAKIDPNLAAAHAFLGWMHMWGEGFKRALSEHKTALSLDPNSSDGHLWQASSFIYAGTPELAIAPMDRAMRLEPHTPPIYLLNYGHLMLQLDRYEEAIEYLQAAIRNAPQFPMNYIFLSAVKTAQGKLKEAEEAGMRLLELIPVATVSTLSSQLPYAKEEHRQKVVAGLKAAGLPD